MSKEWPKPSERLINRPDAAPAFIKRMVDQLAERYGDQALAIHQPSLLRELQDYAFGQVAYSVRTWLADPRNTCLPTSENLADGCAGFRFTDRVIQAEEPALKPVKTDSPAAKEHKALFAYQCRRFAGEPEEPELEARLQAYLESPQHAANLRMAKRQ